MAGLSAVNPHGLSESSPELAWSHLQGAIVDPTAMQLLHMNTVADPNREPSFTFFGNPNFFFETVGSTTPIVGQALLGITATSSQRLPALSSGLWSRGEETRGDNTTRFLHRSCGPAA